jgi:hypothetical protein
LRAFQELSDGLFVSVALLACAMISTGDDVTGAT